MLDSYEPKLLLLDLLRGMLVDLKRAQGLLSEGNKIILVDNKYPGYAIFFDSDMLFSSASLFKRKEILDKIADGDMSNLLLRGAQAREILPSSLYSIFLEVNKVFDDKTVSALDSKFWRSYERALVTGALKFEEFNNEASDLRYYLVDRLNEHVLRNILNQEGKGYWV